MGNREQDDQAGVLGHEAGGTLILTLALITFSSIALAALIAYTDASNRSVEAFRDQRDQRYAGDGAVKAAVNWARNETLASIDAAIATGKPCLYVRSDAVGVVTVSCSMRPGGGDDIDDPIRRLAFVACVQSSGRQASGAVCAAAQDRILTQAEVDIANHMGRVPNVATIRSWGTER